MKNQVNPTARQNGLVIQEMPNETLIYDLKTNRAHCLNESAAFVWRACTGTNSISDIVAAFEKTGAGTVDEAFVWLAIDQLNKNDLLEAGLTTRFAGRSRREALKTIGLASAVALPVIASLVAPQSALGSVSCACQSPAECASRTGCPSIVNCNNNGLCAP